MHTIHRVLFVFICTTAAACEFPSATERADAPDGNDSIRLVGNDAGARTDRADSAHRADSGASDTGTPRLDREDSSEEEIPGVVYDEVTGIPVCIPQSATAFVHAVGDPFDGRGVRNTQGFRTGYSEGYCMCGLTVRSLNAVACQQNHCKWLYGHTGRDRAAKCGTPVRAITSGVITKAEHKTGDGCRVHMQYDEPERGASYHHDGHMCTDSSCACLTVTAGDCAELGERTGEMGSTGYSSGCHDHEMCMKACVNDRGYLRNDPDHRMCEDEFDASGCVYKDPDWIYATRPILSRYHTPGTLYKVGGLPEIYLLDGGEMRHIAAWNVFVAERFRLGHVIIGPVEYLDCYERGAPITSAVIRRLIRCGEVDFMVRLDNLNRNRIRVPVGTREYEALVRSWGFAPNEIMPGGALCSGPESFDPLYLRDGSVVREDNPFSTVHVITSHGAARPVDSWFAYLSLGYQENDLQLLPNGTLPNVTRVIQPDRRITRNTLDDCPTGNLAYGEGPDDGIGGIEYRELVSPDELCELTGETCDGKDNGRNGAVDENGCPNAPRNAVRVIWTFPEVGCASRAYWSDWIAYDHGGLYSPWREARCDETGTAGIACDITVPDEGGVTITGNGTAGYEHGLYRYLCENPDPILNGGIEIWYRNAPLPFTIDDFGDGCNLRITVPRDEPVCVPRDEVCNGADDDCNGAVDDSLVRSCFSACGSGTERCNAGVWGPCSAPQPQPEVCNYVDDNCNGVADEGLRNACGGCGPVPTEVCNYADDDCDGVVDDGVRNACGSCGPVPTELCDGIDNNCNGLTDEGVTNPCGFCGPVPAERCDNLVDDDCDGVANEGCAPACPPEVCDGLDNDCDGLADDGVMNRCGLCGPEPTDVCGNGLDEDCDGVADDGCLVCSPEVCDGRDNDCDGQTDEGLGTSPCGVGACWRVVNNCVGGVLQSCVPGSPTPEICGNGVDEDCNGADQPCPPPPVCDGHTVRILWEPGYDGDLNSDLPDNARWDPYPIVGGRIDRTFTCVPNYEARMNAFLNGAWASGLRDGRCVTPFGMPRAWIDGVETSVESRLDPRIPGGGCNFFLLVSR